MEAKGMGEESFDSALPQPWCDMFRLVIGEYPVWYFVWLYPKGCIWGQPFPLTWYGEYLLNEYNRVRELDEDYNGVWG
jgi:hypothetical protein